MTFIYLSYYTLMILLQVLYEIAFAFGTLTGPYIIICIYTLRPRTRVPCHGVITDIGDPPLVLVVEASDNGPDMESIKSPHEVGIVHACVHVQRLLLDPTLEQLLTRLAIQAAAELQSITIFLQGLPPQWSSSLSILCCL